MAVYFNAHEIIEEEHMMNFPVIPAKAYCRIIWVDQSNDGDMRTNAALIK